MPLQDYQSQTGQQHSMCYLFGCFQCVGVHLVHDIGFCADVVITFVGHKAHVGIICGL